MPCARCIKARVECTLDDPLLMPGPPKKSQKSLFERYGVEYRSFRTALKEQRRERGLMQQQQQPQAQQVPPPQPQAWPQDFGVQVHEQASSSMPDGGLSRRSDSFSSHYSSSSSSTGAPAFSGSSVKAPTGLHDHAHPYREHRSRSRSTASTASSSARSHSTASSRSSLALDWPEGAGLGGTAVLSDDEAGSGDGAELGGEPAEEDDFDPTSLPDFLPDWSSNNASLAGSSTRPGPIHSTLQSLQINEHVDPSAISASTPQSKRSPPDAPTPATRSAPGRAYAVADEELETLFPYPPLHSVDLSIQVAEAARFALVTADSMGAELDSADFFIDEEG